ncbi:MAG TPA: 16S rRNA (uracil(1498)-N(3))-methyltransferase [Steroidobacteraceae bacterium]|nr:16S rRNA (uracil(1498)-N(3))-methyltransferase [Steroidobacteraceae bacterium]
MRLTRVYVEEPLAAGTTCVIGGSAANHIARVLRLREGDALTLFDGRGGEYGARIAAFRKEAVLAQVQEHRDVELESALDLTLVQGISRGERMDWVMQKATELGVRRIVPVLTERSVVKLDDRHGEKKLQHWRGVVIAACEQCGRNRVPEVTAPMPFHEALSSAITAPPLLAQQRHGVSAHPRADAGTGAAAADHERRPADRSPKAQTGDRALTGGAGPDGAGKARLPADVTRLLLSPQASLRVRDLPRPARVALLIGPEGGLADAEQDAAVKAGFIPVQLGPRILRTETAAIAALAALQHDFGDL